MEHSEPKKGTRKPRSRPELAFTDYLLARDAARSVALAGDLRISTPRSAAWPASW